MIWIFMRMWHKANIRYVRGATQPCWWRLRRRRRRQTNVAEMLTNLEFIAIRRKEPHSLAPEWNEIDDMKCIWIPRSERKTYTKKRRDITVDGKVACKHIHMTCERWARQEFVDFDKDSGQRPEEGLAGLPHTMSAEQKTIQYAYINYIRTKLDFSI